MTPWNRTRRAGRTSRIHYPDRLCDSGCIFVVFSALCLWQLSSASHSSGPQALLSSRPWFTQCVAWIPALSPGTSRKCRTMGPTQAVQNFYYFFFFLNYLCDRQRAHIPHAGSLPKWLGWLRLGQAQARRNKLNLSQIESKLGTQLLKPLLLPPSTCMSKQLTVRRESNSGTPMWESLLSG